jgi:alanine-glyoxylate transaminase/serine-glyoxylate transaminase/serine-pyruvate transaminase
MHNASGHGAWEASLTNLLSPGNAILVLESGDFPGAGQHGPRTWSGVRPLPDWRRGVDPAQVKSALAADTTHAIKAVCVVHNETRPARCSLDEIRAAIDGAKHPALFPVDTISSLGSLDFRMDEWKIDCVVGGSQKGLMLPRARLHRVSKRYGGARRAKLPRFYFDWTLMRSARRRFHRHIP